MIYVYIPRVRTHSSILRYHNNSLLRNIYVTFFVVYRIPAASSVVEMDQVPPPPPPHHPPRHHVIGTQLPWHQLINWNRLLYPSFPVAAQLLRYRAAAAAAAASTIAASATINEKELVDYSVAVECRHQVSISNLRAKSTPQFPMHYAAAAGGPPRKRMFTCQECRYATDRKNNLKRHVTTMHSTSVKQLDCCGLQFPSKVSFKYIYIYIYIYTNYN